MMMMQPRSVWASLFHPVNFLPSFFTRRLLPLAVVVVVLLLPRATHATAKTQCEEAWQNREYGLKRDICRQFQVQKAKLQIMLHQYDSHSRTFDRIDWRLFHIQEPKYLLRGYQKLASWSCGRPGYVVPIHNELKKCFADLAGHGNQQLHYMRTLSKFERDWHDGRVQGNALFDKTIDKTTGFLDSKPGKVSSTVAGIASKRAGAVLDAAGIPLLVAKARGELTSLMTSNRKLLANSACNRLCDQAGTDYNENQSYMPSKH